MGANDGKSKATEPKVTMKDIAAHLNIDRTTVSKAMARVPGVSDQMVRRVREAAEELGYRKDIIASSLATGKNALLGIVLADMGRGIYAPFIDRFYYAAHAEQYGVLLQYVDHDRIGVQQVVEVLRAQRVSGIVFISGATWPHHNKLLIELAESDVAVATTGRGRIHERIDAIRFDNEGAGYEVTTHLVALGHRDIGFIGVNEKVGTMAERFNGYKRAMDEAELKPMFLSIGNHVGSIGISVLQAYDVTRTYWASGKRLSAIVGGNDDLALGSLQALKETGILVPQDVSIVGFDDLHAELAVPHLTSMRMPVRESGERAVKMLLNRTIRPEKQAEYEVIRYELMVRGSTAPIGKR
jgi:LacI family transcriptional regulator